MTSRSSILLAIRRISGARAGCDLVDSVERSHPALAFCFSEHVHAAADRK